jgi:hypothetical protein
MVPRRPRWIMDSTCHRHGLACARRMPGSKTVARLSICSVRVSRSWISRETSRTRARLRQQRAASDCRFSQSRLTIQKCARHMSAHSCSSAPTATSRGAVTRYREIPQRSSTTSEAPPDSEEMRIDVAHVSMSTLSVAADMLPILPRVAGETFYEACQVPLNFFQAAWRIFCRVMLAK